MPICSYLVIPKEGESRAVQARLSEIPGCEAVPAENRDLILLVTDTPGLDEEGALRSSVERLDGIEALLFTFGEIDPDADIGDPISIGRSGRAGRRGR